MGKPELYSLRMDFSINGKVSDASDSKFGIREVDSELNKNDKRFFTINGKKILIRGGGWSPDMLLRAYRSSSGDRAPSHVAGGRGPGANHARRAAAASCSAATTRSRAPSWGSDASALGCSLALARAAR